MTSTGAAVSSVRSADGTVIAVERAGDGPPLVLVDAAGGYREVGPLRSLARLLAADFTVLTYDRRGRGESTDIPPYAVEREVEDLAAVIAGAGGTACVYGYSSGGLLALHAAASGLPIPKLVLFEPPIEDQAGGESAFTAELAALVEAGRRGEAVEHFHRSIGVPAEMLDEMRATPAWPALAAIAHTLVYDCRISDATSLEVARAVTAPTLVLDSTGTSGELPGWAAGLVDALPNGSHRSLEGEWHGAPEEDVAAAVTEFLRG